MHPVWAPERVHTPFQVVSNLFPRFGQPGRDPWCDQVELVAVLDCVEQASCKLGNGVAYAYDRSDF